MLTPTVLHLFAGSGGCTLGFQRAGFRSLGSIDFDAVACRDLERLTGGPAFCRDIAAMEPADLRDLTGGECPDVVVMSPPCLPADGMVLTSRGPKRIDTIIAGERVLSHKGRYCSVAKVNTRAYKGVMYGLRLNGTVDADVQWYTSEHPVWVRRVVRGTDKVRTMRSPTWLPACQVRVGDRVGFPVMTARVGTAAEFVASCGDPRCGDDRVLGRVRDLSEHATSPALWALLGAYLGDGDRRAKRSYTIRWSVGARNGEAYNLVAGALMAIGLKFHIEANNDRNVRICTDSRHLWMLCGRLGSSSAEKTIPEDLMGLEDGFVEAMVNGLSATDGHSTQQRKGDGSDRPDAAAVIVQRLMLRFGRYGGIHRVLRAGRAIIEGREVNVSDSYRVVFNDRSTKTCYKFEDGALWLRVKKIHERETVEPVWNLEVDEDDTYCSPLIATHNCKSFSGCMPAQRARETRYVDMSQLATRGMFLAMESWGPKRPKLVLLENVPRMQNRGAELLAQIIGLLQASGYATDQRTHDCGELGGLAQHRQRFLLVARDMAACPDFLRLPQHQRVRAIGEVLGPLPSPASDHGDELHRLPLLSAMNWLRLAAIRAGKGRPDSYGVCDWTEASPTVRGQQKVHTSRASVADPRLGERAGRQNGGFGVEPFAEPSHAILGEGTVRDTRASVADPRLSCEPRTGAYGVEDFGAPSATVVGHHRHDNGPASVADPRLDHEPRRGTFGVLDPLEPAPTVRASHGPRQAPAAILDERGYPVATHELVRQGGDLVLRGPAVDLRDPRPRLIVIRAPDGTWHRPLTDRELAVLQGFPVDCYLEGPSSSSKRRVGRREHIGNAIPPPTAEAIARECMATLEAAADGTWRLGGGGVWVREEATWPR